MPTVDDDLAISLSVRCSIALYQRAAAIAADNERTVSEVVRLALDLGLEELDGAVVISSAPSADENGHAPHA